MMLHTKYQSSRPCGFRQEDFFHIFPISALPNIKALGPVVSDKKIFSHFPYMNLCKTCDPRGGGIFGPRGIF